MTRREFVETAAGALAGIAFVGCDLPGLACRLRGVGEEAGVSVPTTKSAIVAAVSCLHR